MSDTPETDKARLTERNGCCMTYCSTHIVAAEFARRLERERDQLRAINAELVSTLDEVLNDWQYGLEIHQADSYDIARALLTKAKAIKP
jgi:hypothetical protein